MKIRTSRPGETTAPLQRATPIARQILSSSHVCVPTVMLAAMSVVQAQEVPQETSLEEVMVTGSRVQRTDGMATPNPVTAISAEQMNSMAPLNMIDAFDQLPQFINNESRTTVASKGGAAGASNLDLRGLGSQRQLVLLNGRRIVPSNRSSTVDISLFPQALVSNVEIVTGGASATYGSDAVSGVVNFLLDTNYAGFEGDLQLGQTDYGDDENWKVSFTGGVPIGERMHFVGAVDWLETDGICNEVLLTGCEEAMERDWYQRQGTVTNPEWLASDGEVGPRLITTTNVVATHATHGGLINAPDTSIDGMHFLTDGSAVPFEFSDLSGTLSQRVDEIALDGSGQNVGGSGVNFRDDRPTLIQPQERGSAFLNFDYDLSDAFTFSASTLFGHQESVAPGTLPLGYGSRAPTIFQENAFLPDNIRQAMIDEGIESFTLDRMHSSLDLGRDQFINRNRTVSASVGVTGDLQRDGFLDDWNLTAYYQWGRNQNLLSFENFFRRDHVSWAVDAVEHPETGEVVCNITLHDPSSECVPLNLLGAGQASAAALDYATDDMWVEAMTHQEVAEAVIDGPVGENWAGPVFMAFGASWREDRLDQTLGPNEFVGQPPYEGNDPSEGRRGLPPAWNADAHNTVFRGTDIEAVSGGFDVKELFAEASVPLLGGNGFVRESNLSLATRWADYAGSGSVVAWRAGADLRLGDAVRLRTTLSHDVRAANLAERFDRQRQSASIEDPEFNFEEYVARQIFGGNPNVDPEEADTLSVGLVIQPPQMERFSLSVDWTDIDLEGRIGQLGVETIVEECFAGATEVCQQVQRDPETNRILNVTNTFVNIHASKVTATDWEMRYSFGADQAWQTRLLLTYLLENSITNRGAPTVDRVGEGSFARIRGIASLTYSNGPFSLYLQERYTSSRHADLDWVEGVDIDNNSIDAAYYTDLRLSYEFEQSEPGWEIYANINNLFDEEPRFEWSQSIFSGSSYGSSQELLGRRYTVGMRMNF